MEDITGTATPMHCAGRPPGSPKTDPVAMLGHANTILSTFQHEVLGVCHSLAHGTYGTTSKPCSHTELFPIVIVVLRFVCRWRAS